METLQNILEILDSAIDEVQSWSLIISILSTEKYNDDFSCDCCSDFNGKIVKQLSFNSHCKDNIPWHTDPSLENIIICKRGHAFIKPSELYIPSDLDVNNSQKYEWLRKFGRTIYHSLDRGLEGEEERVLLPTTTKVIELLLFTEEDDDEGIEANDNDITRVVSNIINQCSEEITSSDISVFSTATSVLKALYSQVEELQTFLKRIEPSKESQHEQSQEFDALGRREWARLWMQVMHDMREKAAYHISKSRDINWNRIGFKQFELTPFEIVMVEVKNQRQRLRKVEFNPELRMNARDEILDFIRSRPPLKKASDRILLSPVKVEPTPRDKLLGDIRKQNFYLKSSTEPNDGCSQNQIAPKTNFKRKVSPIKRKILKPDQTMYEIFSPMVIESDISSFDFPPKSSRSQSVGTLDGSWNNSNNSFHSSLHQSPQFHHNERNPSSECDDTSLRTISPDCISDSGNLSTQNRRPQSLLDSSFSVPTKKKLVKFHEPEDDYLSDQNDSSDLEGLSSHDEDWVPFKRSSPQKKTLTRRRSINLNLSELCHIRKVLTNADLENSRGHENKELYDQLLNEKICFVCRKSRFNMLERWFSKKRCEICLKAICTDCLLETCIQSDFANFPVDILSPNSSIKRCVSSGNIHSSRGADYETKKTCRHCAILIHDVKGLQSIPT